MLGTRGVRLALLYPEIPRMQVRAIARAALAVAGAGGDPRVEIMVPLVAFSAELERMRDLVDEVMAEELERAGSTLPYTVGTMIELPRAAICADEIAGARRLLQLRHQRPDPDGDRHLPRRRRGGVPRGLPRRTHRARQPVRLDRPRRRG